MCALKQVSEVRKVEAFDADLHAENLTNWQQQYDQVSNGSFYGSITELAFDNIQVFQEHTSHDLQQKCMVWPDSIWMGIPLAQQNECRINGLTIKSDSIMCRPGSREFHLTTPKNYDLYGIVVEREALERASQIHGIDLQWQELTLHGRLSLPERTLHDVRYILARMLGTGRPMTSERISRDLVMMALLEVLKTETPQPASTPSYFRRKCVVDEACAYIDANPDEPVTVTDLCQRTNVSRRTLQYSFESIIGISPIQYLRVSRLNGVRRQFLTTTGHSNVADIACQWGFWHMSQFAKDYKTLFGERPSETLCKT